MTPKSIAIIGGGPGGLVLARILHTNNIFCTVFEGEASPNTRTQGGSLDLHPRSGQAALLEAGLIDEFKKHARYEGEDLIIKDKHNKAHVEILNTERGRPEIDRTQLRQILLDSLPTDTIKWDHRVSSVEVGAIHFTNKPSAGGFDLIIGADGAWSKVRPLLTTIPPFYSGISGIELRHSDLETKHPEIAAMVGQGSHFVFGESARRVLLSQRQGDGSLRTYVFMHASESYLHTHPDADVESTRALLLAEFAEFAPELKRLITDCDDDTPMTTRALYMLPVGLSWPSTHGLTLIGDAAHLMTPFAGEGVNMAMLDSLELARSIISSSASSGELDLDAAVKQYEEGMFPRAEKVMQKAWRSLMSRFREGGIAEMKERVARGMEEARREAVERGGKMPDVRLSED